MRLLVATTNAGKLEEIRDLLADVPLELATLAAHPPINPPEETGATFAENARLKARFYAARTGALTVAEDSGLEVDVLGGAPGVESARFGGADSAYAEKFALLYRMLRAAGVDRLMTAHGPDGARADAGSATASETGLPEGEAAAARGNRTGATARFVCALAVADGDRILFETCGTIEGEIAAEPRGTRGFGYDPIFFYPPFACTLAEAGERKGAVSHRGRAFRHLRSWLMSQVLRSIPPP